MSVLAPSRTAVVYYRVDEEAERRANEERLRAAETAEMSRPPQAVEAPTAAPSRQVVAPPADAGIGAL